MKFVAEMKVENSRERLEKGDTERERRRKFSLKNRKKKLGEISNGVIFYITVIRRRFGGESCLYHVYFKTNFVIFKFQLIAFF